MSVEAGRMLDEHRRRRPFRGVAYACLATGSAVLIYDPFRSLENVGGMLRWGWSGIMLAGSLFSIAGTLLDKWVIEWLGLPLQITAMGGLMWVLISGNGNTAAVAIALWLATIVVFLSGRMLDLWLLARATLRAAKRERRRTDE